MALDPRLSLLVQSAEIEDPRAVQARGMTLRNLTLNTRQTELKNQKLERDAADAPARAEAARQKALRDQRKADLDAEEGELKVAKGRATRLGSLTGSVVDQRTKDWAIGQGVREGLIPKEHAAELIAAPFDDDFKAQLKQFRDAALTAEQQLDQALKDRAEKRAADVVAETGRHHKAMEGEQRENRGAANTRAANTLSETTRHHKAMEARPTRGQGAGAPTNTQLNAIEGRKKRALEAAESEFKKAASGAAGRLRMNEHLADLRKAKQAAQDRYEQELRQHGLPVQGFQYSEERAPAKSPKTATAADVAAYAKQKGINDAQARREFESSGYAVR